MKRHPEALADAEYFADPLRMFPTLDPDTLLDQSEINRRPDVIGIEPVGHSGHYRSLGSAAAHIPRHSVEHRIMTEPPTELLPYHRNSR